jgi:DNA polymerase elongation subunit (family B)
VLSALCAHKSHGQNATLHTTELALLKRWLAHIRETKPQVYVTYNGDFFDFPFIEDRLKKYGLVMTDEIGIWREKSGEVKGRFSVHLDAFHWVKRDSYLPQGSQGLKAVTKAKLGYDPKELDPGEIDFFLFLFFCLFVLLQMIDAHTYTCMQTHTQLTHVLTCRSLLLQRK